jgi:hypothetical protein
MKGNQVCSIEGPDLLQRGDNHKIVKMGWGYLKILLLIKNYEARNAELLLILIKA